MLAVFVAIFVFGSALGALVRNNAPTDQINRMFSATEGVARQVGERGPERVDLTGGEFYILADDGALVRSNGALENTPDFLAFNNEESSGTRFSGTITVQDTEYRAVRIDWVTPGTDTVGWVVGVEPTAIVTEQIEGLQAVTFIAATLATIVAGAAAWFATGRALRPLASIVQAADAIDDQSDELLPPARHDDEIGSLTASLNGMLARLANARNDLQESANQQEQFVADASHELRSPLTTIRSNAEFISTKPDATANDVSSAANDIVSESERMSHLVDDLLSLARSDQGSPLRTEEVDFTGLLARSAHAHTTERRPVTLDISSQITVDGDEADLSRLVQILIDNAMRYGAGAIELGLMQYGQTAEMTVTDQGPGFRPEDQPKVFDRFYRASTARSPDGAGLGLAIAKATVERHGGTIHAENAVSNNTAQGGRIVVSLPVSKQATTSQR